VIAGRIAALIGDDVMRAAGPVRGRAGAAVTRAWEAVEKTTGIRRSEAPRR
jgi:hypothetical protein